jgi:hypothetical protein
VFDHDMLCLTTCAGVMTLRLTSVMSCSLVVVGTKAAFMRSSKNPNRLQRNIRSFRNLSQIRDHDMFHDMIIH